MIRITQQTITKTSTLALGLLLMAAMLLCNACVESLDTDYAVDAPILVVQASLVDTLILGMPEVAPMQVNLFSLVPSSSTYVQGGLENAGVENATVRIIDTEENTYELQHQGDGLYTNETNGKEGVGYHLQITLDNGSTITSTTENVQSSNIVIDSLTVTTNGATTNTATTEVETLIHSSNPQSEDAYYIHKSWREYEFREDPELNFPKTCYLTEAIDTRNVTINQIRSDQVNASNIVSNVSYDSRFAFKLFFHNYQYQISELTYEYYQQVEQNKSQSDVLFAPIPGKIKTNITLQGSDTRDLHGFFTVGSVDYRRIKADPVILGQTVIFACPTNSSRSWSSNPLRDFCGDCLLYDNATIERPTYW